MKYLGPISDNKDLVTKEYVDRQFIQQKKTYTGVIGTANNWANATFFFGSVKPTTWREYWRIKYKIRVYVPGKPDYNQIADVMISGRTGDLRAWYSLNTIGSYYVCYYHELYRLTETGFNNGYGHSIGVRFYSAYAPIDTNYKRTIEVEILETENCTFSFYNSCLKYAEIPGTGSTNYNTYSEMDFVSNGLQETGDANDVNYYNRSYYGSRTTSAALYRYQFCLTKRDGTLVPVNSVNNSVATNKTLTTDTFDPFGEIFYWASTSTYSANANVGNGYWYRQYLADLRYSFNCGGYDVTGTLTARAPLFLVCALQSDGMAKLHSSPLSMTLPNSDDGLIYIYLGRVYEDTYPYRVVLTFNHPIYYYKGGRVRELVDTATYAENAGAISWSNVSGKPTATGNKVTGISIAAHGTGTVIGVQSTTTTASKVTVGSHSTDYGIKAAGSASTWTFEEKTIPNVTSAGTASSWTFEEKTIPNVTAAGSGSASLTFAMDTTDTKKLKITFSHTHTAPTIGTAIKVQSKSGGSNGTAPTLGTAIKVQSKSGGANGSAPTLGSKVPTVSASDVTVPIKNSSASTFVTGTTHTVTDNGHTHTI